MAYSMVSKEYWKNTILPAVKVENDIAHDVLLKMTEQYDRFGVNGTRALRVASFVPNLKLRFSFRFDSTLIVENEWQRIDKALEDKGVYRNK